MEERKGGKKEEIERRKVKRKKREEIKGREKLNVTRSNKERTKLMEGMKEGLQGRKER